MDKKTNDKNTIKDYKSKLRSEKFKLALICSIISICGFSSLSCILAYFNIGADTIITDDIYENVKNYLLGLAIANTGMAAITATNYRKIYTRINELKLEKAFLEGNYETCVCNEEDDLSQKPVVGCEQFGDLTEVPQTLTRK